MKKILLLLCFFLVGNSLKAQDITGIVLGSNFTCQKVNDNQYSFLFHTFFSMGSENICPPFVNYTFSIENDTLNVKAYYDIRGAWPQMGCDRYDTVIYNNSLPETINHIKVSTNVIGSNFIPPYIPDYITYNNVYSQIFNVSSLSSARFDTNNLSVYPNPTKGYINISSELDFQKIALINSFGQTIKSFNKNQFGNYKLEDIPDGFYYLLYYDVDNKRIGQTKIIKSS